MNPSAAPGKTSSSVRRRGRQRAVGRDLSAEGAGGLVCVLKVTCLKRWKVESWRRPERSREKEMNGSLGLSNERPSENVRFEGLHLKKHV